MPIPKHRLPCYRKVLSLTSLMLSEIEKKYKVIETSLLVEVETEIEPKAWCLILTKPWQSVSPRRWYPRAANSKVYTYRLGNSLEE